MWKHSSRYEYKIGEPVWAYLNGYPWWPARVVSGDEIALGEDIAPEVGKGEVLVEFFNDNKRFACMRLRSLRPFLNINFRTLNQKYKGSLLTPLKVAIEEAMEYVQDSPFQWYSESSKEPTKQQTDLETIQVDHTNPDFSSSPKKRKKIELVAGKETCFNVKGDPRRKHRRVEEAPIHSGVNEGASITATRENQVHLSDGTNNTEPSANQQKSFKNNKLKQLLSFQHKSVPPISRTSIRSSDAIKLADELRLKATDELKASPKVVIDNQGAENNDLFPNLPKKTEKPRKDKIKPPAKNTPFIRQANLKGSHNDIKKGTLTVEGEGGNFEDKVGGLNKLTAINSKKSGDNPREGSKVVSQISEEQVKEECAKRPMYLGHNRQELLLSVRTLVHSLKVTRRKVWDLDLRNASLESERDGFRVLIEPLMGLIKKYLSIAGSKQVQEELKLAEVQAVNLINDLLRAPFHPEVLLENEQAARKMVKLADISSKHSLQIAGIMRELLFSWANEVVIYQRTQQKGPKMIHSSRSPSGEAKDSPSSLNTNELAEKNTMHRDGVNTAAKTVDAIGQKATLNRR